MIPVIKLPAVRPMADDEGAAAQAVQDFVRWALPIAGMKINKDGYCPKCGRELVERELLTSRYMGCPKCDK